MIPMKRRKKGRVTITLDQDVIDAIEETAVAQRTNVSALVNVTLADRFIGDAGRDPREPEEHHED